MGQPAAQGGVAFLRTNMAPADKLYPNIQLQLCCSLIGGIFKQTWNLKDEVDVNIIVNINVEINGVVLVDCGKNVIKSLDCFHKMGIILRERIDDVERLHFVHTNGKLQSVMGHKQQKSDLSE